jgi:hypothetical protein
MQEWGIACLILELDDSPPHHTQGKSHLYPLDKRFGGPQSRYGCLEEEKNLLPMQEIEPRFLDSSPWRVAILAELSRLFNNCILKNKLQCEAVFISCLNNRISSLILHIIFICITFVVNCTFNSSQ